MSNETQPETDGSKSQDFHNALFQGGGHAVKRGRYWIAVESRQRWCDLSYIDGWGNRVQCDGSRKIRRADCIEPKQKFCEMK